MQRSKYRKICHRWIVSRQSVPFTYSVSVFFSLTNDRNINRRNNLVEYVWIYTYTRTQLNNTGSEVFVESMNNRGSDVFVKCIAVLVRKKIFRNCDSLILSYRIVNSSLRKMIRIMNTYKYTIELAIQVFDFEIKQFLFVRCLSTLLFSI